jgi:hypothetical protein
LNPVPRTTLPGLYIPYLAANGNALAAKPKPAPIAVPSCPNFILFNNLATAKSLPDFPSSLIFLIL